MADLQQKPRLVFGLAYPTTAPSPPTLHGSMLVKLHTCDDRLLQGMTPHPCPP